MANKWSNGLPQCAYSRNCLRQRNDASKQKAPLEHSNFTEIVYEFYRNQFIFHTKKRMKKTHVPKEGLELG
jgi:hypothetical protein